MGDWVAQTRGKYRGRVGVIVDDDGRGSYIIVRFGAGGPESVLKRTSTRRATRSEIAEKLGCRPVDLPYYLKVRHPE
jgi:hypothetical protein